MNNVLIMGGSTFVGEALAKYLIKKGYYVDILTRGKKSINYIGFKDHITCDRKNSREMNEKLKYKEYQFIFDISAYTGEDTKILLDSINKKSLIKYIMCSSGAVYKSTSSLIDETFPIGENYNWGSYGQDKIAAEKNLINSGINYTIFRPTYIYGEENNLYREIYFFDRISNGEIIPIPEGDVTTQFIYIGDLVKVFESAMFNYVNDGIYNLTHPHIFTWEELLKECSKVIGEPALIKIVKDKDCEVRRYFPFRNVTYMLGIQKLTNDRLYVPRTTIHEGLANTYKWYKANNIKLKDNKMNMIDEIIFS